jgi:hypothetical protein
MDTLSELLNGDSFTFLENLSVARCCSDTWNAHRILSYRVVARILFMFQTKVIMITSLLIGDLPLLRTGIYSSVV